MPLSSPAPREGTGARRTAAVDAEHVAVNAWIRDAWIRDGGMWDGVLDFDGGIRDPVASRTLP
jgi:hypothetical protein